MLYFSLASTSHDMTQPADNINVNTTRHLSTTVIHYNVVVYYAADMQTQDTERQDKSQAFTSQQNTVAANDTINDDTKPRTFDVSNQSYRMPSGSRDFTRDEEPNGKSVDEGTVDIYCLLRPSTCNYGNQCAAQFPKGIIIHYEEIISLDKSECSHVISEYNSGCNGTHQKAVYDNQDTETNVHWHLSSYIDFITDNRMTFDEFIAEQRKLSSIPKKSVLTTNVAAQCGWADNTVTVSKNYQNNQDFLLDQFKHHPEAEIAIKNNSIGTRSSSSQAITYCPRLKSNRTTNINSNIVLKYKCFDYKPITTQLCYGDELGTLKLTSMRIAGPIQTDPLQLKMNTDPLQYCSAPIEIIITMSLIGRQQEVPSVPDDGTTFENITRATPTLRNRVQDMQHNPPTAARATADPPYKPPAMGRLPACIFSPTAPQVENYVDTTGSTTVLSCIYVPPRVETTQIGKYADYLCTCNVARVKAVISPRTTSEVENKAGTTSQATPLVKKPRVSTSSATLKLITGSGSRREPLSTLNIDTSYAPGQAMDVKNQDNIEILLPRDGTSSSTLGSATSNFTTSSSSPDRNIEIPSLISSSSESGINT